MDIHIPSVDECLACVPGWSELLLKMNHNQKLLTDVLRMMGREAPKLSLAFKSAVEKGDAREARRAVHTLKSNCRQFDLMVISKFAQQLEDLALMDNPVELAAYVSAVQQIGDGISQWVEKMLDEHAVD